MPRRTWGWVPFIAALAACSHEVELRPGAAARTLQDRKDTAVAEAGGVRLTATGIWKGEPDDLWRAVTPIRVGLENHSGGPVRIEYQDFTLTTPAGVTTKAIPPFAIQRPGVIAPYYPATGFWVAAPFAPYYPGFPTWSGAFAYDATYFASSYTWQAPLPSTDMLAKALPVGVLAENGQATGFLYFPRLPPDTRQATLTAVLINAQSGAEVARVTIPFVVTED
jgi:hypothetical protein